MFKFQAYLYSIKSQQQLRQGPFCFKIKTELLDSKDSRGPFHLKSSWEITTCDFMVPFMVVYVTFLGAFILPAIIPVAWPLLACGRCGFSVWLGWG